MALERRWILAAAMAAGLCGVVECAAPVRGQEVEPAAGDPAAAAGKDPAAEDSFGSSFEVAASDPRPLAEQVDPERLDEQTVMMTVTRDQAVEHGAGVVLCQREGRAYVLTAHHVVAGKAPSGGKLPLSPARTEIGFFHDSPPAVIDDPGAGKEVVTFHEVPNEDLLLLSFPLSPELEATAFVGPPRGLPVEEGERSAVLAVGFRQSAMETWAHEPGRLLGGRGSLLHHSARIVEGFSGGPLFGTGGALVGINLGIAGGAAGVEEDAWHGEALSVDEALPILKEWLPAACLRAGPDLGGLAPEGVIPRALRSDADRMSVKGNIYSLRNRFRFGPYHVSGRRRRISFEEADGSVWEGRCKWTEPEPEKIGFFAMLLEVAVDEAFEAIDEKLGIDSSEEDTWKLTCDFKRDGGEKTAQLALLAGSLIQTGGHGSVTAAGVRLGIAGPSIDGQAIFLFYLDDHIMGAVTTADEVVWLHPAVTGDGRSAFLLASAAIFFEYYKNHHK